MAYDDYYGGGGGYQPYTPPMNTAGQPLAPGTSNTGGNAPAGQVGYQGLGDWGSDPFGYTGGSLLTPWTQQLPKSTFGGYSAPQSSMFNYGDFSYGFSVPGGYDAREIATPEAMAAFNVSIPGGYSASNLPGEYFARDIQAPGAFGGYNWQMPEQFNVQANQISHPGKFTYMDMAAPERFQAPSEEEMMADPSYQARLKAGTEALERSAAAAGTLRGGGTQRALAQYGQELGTQEYEKIYGRKASEYDRAYGISRDLYGTNRSNAAENYDRNFRTTFDVERTNIDNALRAAQINSQSQIEGGRLGWDIAQGTYNLGWQPQFQVAQANEQNRLGAAELSGRNLLGAEAARLGAYSASANASLQGQGLAWDVHSGTYDRNARWPFEVAMANEQNRLAAYRASTDAYLGGHGLGYQIAAGTYDRNRENAMLNWETANRNAAASASAGNASADEQYRRTMQEYGLAYDIFQNNQSNQWNRLMQASQLGMNAAGQQGSYGDAYGNALDAAYTGAANAQAAGTVGAAQGYGGGIMGAGSYIGAGAMMDWGGTDLAA